ncbi:MAG: TIGR03013 family PEP-CTERM/XrtA system glycosyltransferase [Planctomycetes bacterium]|nr:TIGR03013 family PEP-CTERM/XrtA system glycosyltransferase [Planctomycetota bacterium]
MRSIIKAFERTGGLVAIDAAVSFYALRFAGVELALALVLAGVVLFVFWLRNLHTPEVYLNHRILFIRGFPAVGICLVLFAVASGFWPEARPLPVLGGGTVGLMVLLIVRLIYGPVLGTRALPKLLVLGTGNRAARIAREIQDAGGYEIMGFVGNSLESVGQVLVNSRPIATVIGTYDELEGILAFEPPSSVVVAEEDRRKSLPMETLLRHKLSGGRVYDAASFLEETLGKIPLEGLPPSWFVFSEGFREGPIHSFLRRVLEVAIATFLLILTLPLCVAVALLIKLGSKGPVFFSQERMGKDGKIFRVLKFRSMRTDAEAGTGPVWATKEDPRVTRIGRWIRKLRIDEIPQLWNVFRGEMALVGPRPERPHFVETLRRQIPYYDERHTVKPGLTGWAQINYPYGSSLEDADEKLQYDFYYIKHRSPLFDLYIAARTIKVVLLGEGSR